MSLPRIGIAHQTVWVGDAIGKDIAGMYRLLARCGFDVRILCEYPHPEVEAGFAVRRDLEAASQEVDLLLYHHSIHWPVGERLLRAFAGPVAAKYHNITPPEFFAPYSTMYRDSCSAGREQTTRLAGLTNVVRWLSDSQFNAAELAQAGVPRERNAVVPPFNDTMKMLCQPRSARYAAGGPYDLLFVGRRAPNKGHAHLLRTVAAWRELFPETEVRLRIAGSPDAEMKDYYRELADLEASLGIGERVDWLGSVTVPDLKRLFEISHLYLNLSEHEGFCVPLIEAQAWGLPTISTRATAIPETAGAGQMLVPVPTSAEDYDLLAGLAHEICTSPALRENVVAAGARNVFDRFTCPVVEARFMEEMEPVIRMVSR